MTVNPFKSDSAPYVATLLVSALGWFLTTLHAEVRSNAILAYQTTLDKGEVTLELRNISSSAVISGAKVALICTTPEPCLQPVRWQKRATDDGVVNEPFYGRPARIAPTGDTARITGVERQITALVTLPPGGRTAIVTPYSGKGPEFFYFQSGATAVRVVGVNSLTGLFVAHYGKLVAGLFALIALALLGWLAINLFKPKETGDAPKPLHVVLDLNDGSGQPKPG